MNDDIGYTFLLQILPLFSSYMFGTNVALEARPLTFPIENAPLDETTQFLETLIGRHALACAKKLQAVLPLIEAEVSQSSALVAQESKGVIRGRLNIPLYISRRSVLKTLPRTYPILINEERPNTPENILIRQTMSELIAVLGRSPFQRNSAEGKETVAAYGWLRARLRRWPWNLCSETASTERLYRSTLHRIRKRQTGNEQGYQAFLVWFAQWRVDIARLGDVGTREIVKSLLAFPVGDFFWEKVFEVWCLSEVASSLIRQGFFISKGPQSLWLRDTGPIYWFSDRSSQPIDLQVWFQRQVPIGAPRWRYLRTGQALRVRKFISSAFRV